MVKRITIPEFVTKVKLSEKRRAAYYGIESKIPDKYKSSRYIFKEKKNTKSKKKLLYDVKEKKFVIKNVGFVGKPRYSPIGGNMLYAGMHERVRMSMINAVKEDFQKYIGDVKPITEFPIQIDAELHTIPGLCNWDVDNLWIYIKSFQDLMVDHKIIPDDTVRYITKPPSFEFYPVPTLKMRKIVFILRTDRRKVITHTMFRTSPQIPIYIKGIYKTIERSLYVLVGDIKAGTVSVTEDPNFHLKCLIGIGKNQLIYNRLVDTLKSIRYWAIQYNTPVVIDRNIATEYPNYDWDKINLLIQKYLSNEGIKVIIHNT